MTEDLRELDAIEAVIRQRIVTAVNDGAADWNEDIRARLTVLGMTYGTILRLRDRLERTGIQAYEPRVDTLIDKLSETMDPDNARAMVASAVREIQRLGVRSCARCGGLILKGRCTCQTHLPSGT